MGCSLEEVRQQVTDELSGTYSGDELELRTEELLTQLHAERAYYKSRNERMAESVKTKMPEESWVHYQSGNPTKEGKSVKHRVVSVTFSAKNETTTVVLGDKTQYTFAKGSEKSNPTKANGTVVEIPAVTEIAKRAYVEDVLYNKDELTDEDIDRLFLGDESTEDTILNVRDELRRLDKGLMGAEYDSAHGEYLDGVLSNVMKLSKDLGGVTVKLNKEQIEKVVEPYGQFDKNDPLAPIKVKTGTLSEEARNRLTMTNEETLVHEVVHAALDWVFDNKHAGTEADALKLQIQDLYKKAKETVTWEDLVKDGLYTEAEQEAAKARYDYIFGKKGKEDTRSAGVRLQEFMAYAMTNKQMKNALASKSTETKKVEHKSMYDKVVHMIADFLASIVHKFKGAKGKTLEEESIKTVYKLMAIKDKYGSEAALRRGKHADEHISERLDKVLDSVDKAVSGRVDDLLQNTLGITKDGMTQQEFDDLYNPIKHNWPKSSDNILVRFIKLARILPKFKAAIQGAEENNRAHVAILWGNFLAEMKIAEDSFLRKLFADFTAGRKTLEMVTDLTMEFRSHIDRLRHQNYEGTLVDVYKDMFSKVNLLGKGNRKYDQALEAVVMTSDLQALDADSVDELVGYVKNPNKKIKELEKRISGALSVYKYGTVIEGARKAAEYSVTGKGLRTNAENVVRGFGTQEPIGYSEGEVDEALVKDVDKLITLYALGKVSKEAKDTLVELAKKDPEGVMAFTEYARGLQTAIREEYQKYEAHEYVKGQVRDTYNRDRELQVVPLFEKKKMNSLGYTLVEVLDRDLKDGDPVQYGKYVNSNMKIAGRVDGAVGLQREKVQGLLLIDKIRMSNPGLTEDAVWKLYNTSRNMSIQKYMEGEDMGDMHPVFNDQGYITDFRFGVSKKDKVKYLELDTRGAEVLAKSEGHIGTQPMTDKENEKVLDVLYKDYAATYNDSGNPSYDTSRLFIHVKAKDFDMSEEDRRELYESGHKELLDMGKYGIKTKGEELWGLLPPAGRESVIRRNNEIDKAKIREDAKKKGTEVYNRIHDADPKFRASLEEQLKQVDENPRRELYVRKDLVAQLFGYNEPSVTDMKVFDKVSVGTKYKVQVVESYWKDFVGLLKGNVVVRLPSTIWNNILSNMRILFYSGVPVRQSVTYMIKSIRSLNTWKKDEEELHRLQRLVKGAKGAKKSKLERDISDMMYRLDNNPLKPLMDKGLYQSVVDDVAIYDDTNRISKKLRGMTEKVTGESGLAKDAVETVFLTQRSKAGQFLLRATRESDFHFRAALYWAKVEKGEDKEDVFRLVTDSFINYSKVINSKTVRWLERMGPEAFWTYFANIQRVNVKMLKESPARVAASKLEQVAFGDQSDIFDSNIFSVFFNRLNPFHGIGSLLEGGTKVPLAEALHRGL